MKIIVTPGAKIAVRFQGKVNMSQEIEIDAEDAKKLAEILTQGKGEMETR